MSADARHLLGRTGEEAAGRHLAGKGYAIIDRNVRFIGGEIDLVALDGATVVLVEVKTRVSQTRAPAEAVDFRKQKKLRLAAGLYLRMKKLENRSARFDVVEVIAPPGGGLMINHIIDAFE